MKPRSSASAVVFDQHFNSSRPQKLRLIREISWFDWGSLAQQYSGWIVVSSAGLTALRYLDDLGVSLVPC